MKITKFEETALDWFGLRSQLEGETGQVQINCISKFSNLKELLNPNVKLLIDEIPFKSEGCARATPILISGYGKPSEVAVAHIHCITSLPVISNCNSNRTCAGSGNSGKAKRC